MGKLNYLLAIFFIAASGYLLISQLETATGFVSRQIAGDVEKLIEIQTRKVYGELKRYPNSGIEFETRVLAKLEFHRFPFRVFIKKFQPGDTFKPAVFLLVIKGKTTPSILQWMEYYGCEYERNFNYKGKLAGR